MSHIYLNNVRVSFPHLYKKPMINGEEGKCGATLMLDPAQHADTLKALQSQINALITERFKGKKIPPEKISLRKGEDKGRPEYEGFIVLSANSKTKPVVIDSSGKGVVTDETDCRIYAGCYVNAKVSLWAQDNNYGKRINCELVAIQFAADGDPLDSSHVSVDEAMNGFGAVAGADVVSANDAEEYDFLNAG